MNDLPVAWTSLCIAVFVLGMRHGLDADHLATIDGLTRLSRREGRRFARWCGALFSIGHGAAVMAIAALVGVATDRWTPPSWLNPTGAWISIGFLGVLGLANLRAAIRTPSGTAAVHFSGLGGWLVARVPGALGPWGVAGVGALFALSFDTVNQAALFAATAGRFGGVERALELGALFVLGMLVSDGLNGYCVARLIDSADRTAALASRVMSLVVAGVSLLVAGFGAARLLWPSVDRFSDGREPQLGLVVIVLTVAGYALARVWKRRFSRTATGASGRRFHA